MSRVIKTCLQTVAAASLALTAAVAQAYSFDCVTGSTGGGADAAGCTSVGESLASWTLVGNVLTIQNLTGAGNASAITGVSFDAVAGQTVALAATQGTGVLFTTGGGAKLPASLGWSVDFEFKPNRFPMSNGVNAGESLVFNLGGVQLADIQSGAFKFGLHIQGLPGDRSEKLINTTAVPEPETYAMVLAGLAVVGGIARRRVGR